MSSASIYRIFKYAVYALLAADILFFYFEEYAAAQHQFADGVAIAQLIEAYASTIDTAAWVVLLLMFELETALLEDEQFTKPLVVAMHTLRALCYGFIMYAFYGYLENLEFVTGATAVSGLGDLCVLLADGWAYAVDLDDYEMLTAANCTTLSAGDTFFRFPGMHAVVDAAGLTDIIRLAWVDVINSATWLLVVLVLEIDVYLQERNRLEGLALYLGNASKFVLYSVLLLAAIYWGIKGDFVDFWDAFLWLVAFAFIELNIFEWRHEEQQDMT